MAQIETTHDLARVAGEMAIGADPVAELEHRGHTLSPALKEQIAAARRAAAALSPAERQRRERMAKAFGPTRLTMQPLDFKPKDLPAGDYDIVAGIGLQIVDEALAGLYDTLVVPHEIAVPDLLSDQELNNLVVNVLRGVFDGIPDGSDITVGTFHITAPPTTLPVPGTNGLVLRVPFGLDIDRVSGSSRQKVTSLVGAVSVGVRVATDTRLASTDGNYQLVVTIEPPPEGSSADDRLDIEIDPSSALQPRPGSQLHSLATVLGLIVDRELAKAEPKWVVSGIIDLPFGKNNALVLQGVDVRTVDTAKGGAIVIGVRAGGPPTPGDPSRLTNPFGSRDANFYVRLHEALVQKILKIALDTGELTKIAKEQNPDAVITSADVSFAENLIQLILKGKIVDACPINKDLHFTATRSIHFDVQGGTIILRQDNSLTPDETDKIICIITTLAAGLILGISFGIFTAGLGAGLALSIGVGALTGLMEIISIPFTKIAYDALTSSGGGPDFNYFPLNQPIPGTELLPRAHLVASLPSEGTLETFAQVDLVPDHINTYVYAAFLERKGLLGRQVHPLAHTQVQLMDQDAPRPTGDDAPIPKEGHRIVFHNRKRFVTEETKFEPPIHDQLLSTAQTDDRGLIRVMLTPTERTTTAGTKVVTTTTEKLDVEESPGSHIHGGPGGIGGEPGPVGPPVNDRPGIDVVTHHSPIIERKPDVYFRVKLPDGRTGDTRRQSSGLTINLGAGRLGTPESPLTFTFRTGIPTVFHP